MERKVVITKWNNKIVTSVLEEDEIAEIHCSDIISDGQIHHTLGNIYVGRIKNIVPNIGAAFIEIAPGEECYYAMEQKTAPIFTSKIGKKPFCVGDELVVQISKEASKTKVPTVTSKLEFTGRYIILSVGDTRIGISKKMDTASRERLKNLLDPYQNESYGVIARTNAKTASDGEIITELEQSIMEYERLVDIAKSRKCFSCLKQAAKSYITDVRNIYGAGLQEIVVEDIDLFEELKTYMAEEQPQNIKKIKLYNEKDFSLSKLYNIENVIQKALRERVWLKSGGYLVIQPTEALTVIDVNSGKYTAKKSEDESYLKINLEGAIEAAKQIRLRNISGIILIDFINLNLLEDTQILMRKLRDELSKDPIHTTLVDITKLHLVEITRKKVRKTLYETV